MLKINKKKLYTECLCLYINVIMIVDTISNVFLFYNKIFKYNHLIEYSLYITLTIIMLYILYERRVSIIKEVVIFLLTTILFAYSFIYNPGLKPIFLKSVLVFYVYVFLISIFLSRNKDFEMFEKTYLKYTVVVALYAISVLICHNKLPHGYSMTFSYNSFYIAGLLFFLGIKQKKWLYLIIFALVTITNLFAGSRGVLLCDFLYFSFLYFFYFMGKQTRQRHIMAMLLLSSSIMVFVFAPDIAEWLRIYSNSRTLELVASRRLLVLSGREIFYESIISEIVAHPFRIRGVLSDRLFMAQVKGYNLKGDFFSAYSHNIFLEILFQFGVVLGSVLIVIIFATLIKTIKRANELKRTNESLVVMYSLSMGGAIGQLVVSNSYLSSITFGIAVAMCIAINMKWKKRLCIT